MNERNIALRNEIQLIIRSCSPSKQEQIRLASDMSMSLFKDISFTGELVSTCALEKVKEAIEIVTTHKFGTE